MTDEDDIRAFFHAFQTDAAAWAERNDVREFMRTRDLQCWQSMESDKEVLVQKYATGTAALNDLDNNQPFEHAPGVEIVRSIRLDSSQDTALPETSGDAEPPSRRRRSADFLQKESFPAAAVWVSLLHQAQR